MRLKTVFLVCRHLAETLAFYRDELGLKPVGERRLQLAEGVELHLHPELSPAEQQRYGLSNPVSADRSGLVLSLRVDSLSPFEGTPIRAPWGDRLLLVRDPEGNQVELAESLGDWLSRGTVAVVGTDRLADRCRELCEPLEEGRAEIVAVTDGSWEEALERVARGGTILALGAARPEENLDTTRLHYEQITLLALPGWDEP